MQRINWIDWVKAWCMTVVVFDHTPHDGSPFLLQFLAGTNLASFFFISGYLKKPSISQKESLKKYFYCLIIPYFIYNAIFYPYWIGKTYIEQGGFPSFSDCLKPIIGTLLGQLDSNFSCQLNGVTWFLLSLFIMHWITDICNRQKSGKVWMIIISIVAMILYGLNKYFHFAPYLPFHGLVRCIPFFFLGNQFCHHGYLKATCIRKDIIIGIISLTISLTFFNWHINESNIIIHILLYFVVCFFSVLAIIHLWCCADKLKSRIVIYISIGTMVIFGLHRMLIGIVNHIIENEFHIFDISYSIPKAVYLTIGIELFLCPIIIFSKQHCPLILGKR
jgi:fucose 4-O-acetylase-like acetyltransferase